MSDSAFITLQQYMRKHSTAVVVAVVFVVLVVLLIASRSQSDWLSSVQLRSYSSATYSDVDGNTYSTESNVEEVVVE